MIFEVGDRVAHDRRGKGRVISVDESSGKTHIRYDAEETGDHGYDKNSLASGKIKKIQEDVREEVLREEGPAFYGGLPVDDQELLRFLKKEEVLCDLDDEQLLKVLAASKSKIKTYEKGDVVFRQGDAGDEFFMILDGSVSVTQAHIGELNRLEIKEGGCFGEMALETGDVRSATIECLEPCRFARLNRADYQSIVGSL